MAVADRDHYWKYRNHGTDPAASPTDANNTAWSATGSGASASNDRWVVTDQVLSVTPSMTEGTIYAVLKYNTTPTENEVLLKLDNGTKKVEVKAGADATKLKVVGATTATFTDLDLTNEYTQLRLSLDSSGNALCYIHEILEDDDGATVSKSVAGASGSTDTAQWGNTSGSVQWSNVLFTQDGAYSPDELAPSQFVTDVLLRIGLSLVNILKDSKRPYLKNYLDSSAIRYGYDLSSNMILRNPPPAVYVLLKSTNSPDFTVLGGSRFDQRFDVQVYIITKGSDFEDAYKQCLHISGDIFDELYLNTGLNANTDTLMNMTTTLDTRIDDDEMVCVHQLNFRYVRRIMAHTR